MSSYFQTFSFPLVVNPSPLPVSLSNQTSSEVLVQDQQKLVLVIGVKPFKPTQLTEEVLKQESIIPQNWNLKNNISSSTKEIKLYFEEGITIIGRLNQIIIKETVDTQNLEKMRFSTVAHHLIDKLNKKKLTKINLQFERSFAIPNLDNFALSYLKKTLLSPKINQELGKNLISGEISYGYSLAHCNLRLKVKAIEKPANISPLLVFNGQFNYKIDVLSLDSPWKQSQILISNWRLDYQTFTKLVTNHFLG